MPPDSGTERAMLALLAAGGVNPDRAWFVHPFGSIHYLRMGSGPPLVLLHGAGGGAANWYRVLRALSDNFLVFAPDLPGFGLSDPVPPRRDLGEQAAETMLPWLHSVMPEPCDIVGTSFGGLAAARLAQRTPDRIRRVVLLDSVGLGRDVPATVRAAALPFLGRVLHRPTPAGMRWLFRRLLVSNAAAIPENEQGVLLEYLIASARNGTAMMVEALSLFTGWLGQREVLTDAELAAWRHPTLLLWGDCDRFLPVAHAQRAARVMPGASLALIHGAGHSPNWERPDEVVRALLDFLRPA